MESHLRKVRSGNAIRASDSGEGTAGHALSLSAEDVSAAVRPATGGHGGPRPGQQAPEGDLCDVVVRHRDGSTAQARLSCQWASSRGNENEKLAWTCSKLTTAPLEVPVARALILRWVGAQFCSASHEDAVENAGCGKRLWQQPKHGRRRGWRAGWRDVKAGPTRGPRGPGGVAREPGGGAPGAGRAGPAALGDTSGRKLRVSPITTWLKIQSLCRGPRMMQGSAQTHGYL